VIGSLAVVFDRASAEFGKGHGDDLVVEFEGFQIFLKSAEAVGERPEQIGVLICLVSVGVESAEACEVDAGFHAACNQ